MDKLKKRFFLSLGFMALLLFTSVLRAATLSQTIKQIKPSIVGVGTVQQTRRPPSKLSGTGFVVADGYHVITNYHVLPKDLNSERNEQLVIFYRQDSANPKQQVKYRKVRLIAHDKEHDLALLRIEGTRLPAVTIEKVHKPEEGQPIAFTGFPIGAILGLFPVTHQGIISSISPVVIPAKSSSTLTVAMIKRLRNPYYVYQLDATAYPGNSGSPMYDIANGKVLGVINKVFIKETKESILQKPSGITYAIPGHYVLQLLDKNKL